VTGSKTQDPGVKNAMFKALHEVVSKAGANMSDTSRQSVLGLIDADNDNNNGRLRPPAYSFASLTASDSMAISNARLLGALVKNIPPTNATALLRYLISNVSFDASGLIISTGSESLLHTLRMQPF